MKRRSINLCAILTYLIFALFDNSFGQNIIYRYDITKCDPVFLPGFGNKTTFTAKVYTETDGQCLPGYAMIIHFEIESTSNERGYCLNKGTKTHTDLHFNTSENEGKFVPVTTIAEPDSCDFMNKRHDHWLHVKTTGCVTEATVTVISEDYGSFGWIRSWAEFVEECPGPLLYVLKGMPPREPGGEPICSDGLSRTKIPRDDNGNNIAEAWPGDNTNGNSDKNWDEEDDPNPNNFHGDGLSRYEEYRGFYTKGNHVRLGPVNGSLQKDLFIYNSNSSYDGLINCLHKIAIVHLITAEEMNCDAANMGDPDDWPEEAGNGVINTSKTKRCINFNGAGETHIVNQHGLWLYYDNPAGDRGDWGLVWGNLSDPSPFHSSAVQINIANITLACANDIGAFFRYGNGRLRGFARFISTPPPPPPNPGRLGEMISATIEHESGHAMGANDHDVNEVEIFNAPQWTPDGWFSTNGLLNPPRRHFQGDMDGADGLRTCPMRYEFPEIRKSFALDYLLLLFLSHDPFWSSATLPLLTDYCNPCKTMIKIADK